jgi:hypothetical protein
MGDRAAIAFCHGQPPETTDYADARKTFDESRNSGGVRRPFVECGGFDAALVELGIVSPELRTR